MIKALVSTSAASGTAAAAGVHAYLTGGSPLTVAFCVGVAVFAGLMALGYVICWSKQ